MFNDENDNNTNDDGHNNDDEELHSFARMGHYFALILEWMCALERKTLLNEME